MAPNANDPSKTNVTSDTEAKTKVPMKIVWRNVIVAIVYHTLALYGLYLAFTSAMWKTILFAIFMDLMALLGITAGAHRLWSHRAYKAKYPLRLFLALLNAVSDQQSIFEWCRNHRVHHKYTDTDADPHNAKRGLFFSHIGWLLVRKHPEVIQKGKKIDLSDLLADPVVRFQKRYYGVLVILLSFVLPTATPIIFWGESFLNSFCVPTMLRHVFSYHQAFMVNSFAHTWGNRPYNRYINPADNLWTVFGTLGEGFHNYHHTFPWDYATSEYGLRYNLTTAFIDFMAWLGLAYDCKTASPKTIRNCKQRMGEDISY